MRRDLFESDRIDEKPAFWNMILDVVEARALDAPFSALLEYLWTAIREQNLSPFLGIMSHPNLLALKMQ